MVLVVLGIFFPYYPVLLGGCSLRVVLSTASRSQTWFTAAIQSRELRELFARNMKD